MSSNANNIYTVSRLNQDVNASLLSNFGLVSVAGEISNLSKPGSGHWYFSLKDSRSQLRCAMFKGRNRYLDFVPENGQQIVLRGKLSIYEARGDYQLVAEHMELAGTGLLQQKFEQSKARLEAAGWFDQDQKIAIPEWPRVIGLVTSPSGAAVRDILHVLARRYPAAEVIIYPTQVQGSAAAPQVCKAIGLASSRTEVDTIILARGGGSIEDLWAFNEESVAAAIRACKLPVISGIGHEVDFTIADLVADLRAPTPSAAAELAVPERTQLLSAVQAHLSGLQRAIYARLAVPTERLAQLHNRLQLRHPERVLSQQSQRVDELEARLKRSIRMQLQNSQHALNTRSQQLSSASPAGQSQQLQARLQNALLRLRNGCLQQLESRRSKLANAGRALDAVSPLNTLARGYAVIRHGTQVVTNSKSVKPGDTIEAQLAAGSLRATVKVVNEQVKKKISD